MKKRGLRTEALALPPLSPSGECWGGERRKLPALDELGFRLGLGMPPGCHGDLKGRRRSPSFTI